MSAGWREILVSAVLSVIFNVPEVDGAGAEVNWEPEDNGELLFWWGSRASDAILYIQKADYISISVFGSLESAAAAIVLSGGNSEALPASALHSANSSP